MLLTEWIADRQINKAEKSAHDEEIPNERNTMNHSLMATALANLLLMYRS